MPFTGVSHKVGEHIDTDAIIPARFLVTTDPKKLGENCMEGLEHGWVKRVQVGDILVAERNFGCGSSREHAPIAILGAGMKAVIAHSFARIFYRNAFNMGLLLLEIGDDVNKIKDGDKLKKGDLIGSFDAQAIIDAGYRTVTPVIVTNSDSYQSFGLLKTGEVEAGEAVLEVK